jgi:predicted PurR-regulated permease PerM
MVELVTDFLIMLFTLFFLFRDSPYLYKTVHDALPIDQKAKAEIFDCLDQTTVAVVRGTLLTALAQSAVAGATYWLLGIPFPLLLGALSGLLALLPVGGTALVWGPVAVYLFLTGAVWKGLVLLAVGAGIVGLMDNVLQPFLVGAGMDLPMILLFFASLGGLAYFGFIGLFLGPIILGLTRAAFHIFQQHYQRAAT